MPVYDYKCQDHGVFDALATIDERDKPTSCPKCGALSARIIRIAPEFLSMDSTKRHAHDVNEKNQHEPTYSTKKRREDDHQHCNGCGSERKFSKSKMLYTAGGEKIFPSMRPWMISH